VYNRVSFVINPISGSSHSTRIIDQAMRKLSENGILVQALRSRHTGHAEELARTAATRTDLIFAVGGDGTVREVIAGSADTGVPVAVIPTGTENIFAKYYRFQTSEASILACIHRGVQHRMDLTYMNGRPFCCGGQSTIQALSGVRLRLQKRASISWVWPGWVLSGNVASTGSA